MNVTLNAIRKHTPCQSGWTKLLTTLGKTQADDEPLSLRVILDSNGLDDALWCLRALGPEHHGRIRLYAVWCARQVQHLMTDPRSIAALDVAERYAHGNATDGELDVAGAAARTAAWDIARTAARDAAQAATLYAALYAAWAAAQAAVRDVARAAVRDTAWDAAQAATLDAALDAAQAAAQAAAQDAQKAKFIEMFCGDEE